MHAISIRIVLPLPIFSDSIQTAPYFIARGRWWSRACLRARDRARFRDIPAHGPTSKGTLSAQK